MSIPFSDLENAVEAYWVLRRDAGSVRAGKHFDPIAALIARFFAEANYPADSIKVRKSEVVLPGYFRPQKQWDLIVTYEDTLVAAFELKALGAGDGDKHSFGKNYNNRIEEALGSAVDLWQAQEAKVLTGERPWLGYFFLMEDEEGSRAPVQVAKGVFAVDPVWNENSSYQQRFAIFCERLLDKKLYDAVCYIISSSSKQRPTQLLPSLDWQHFSAAIAARIAFLKELGIPQ